MKFDYPHTFSQEDAKLRMEALGEYLKNKYGLGVTWTDDQAKFSGRFKIVTIDGTMKVGEGKVDFEGKDPGMLLRKKATSYLKHKLEVYLDPATSLESLPRA